MRRGIIILFLMMVKGLCMAQTPVTISGRLLTEEAQPLGCSYTVVVVRQDSLKTELASETFHDSAFSLTYTDAQDMPHSIYFLAPGYEQKSLPLTNKDENLGDILLPSLSKLLDEVVVTSKLINVSLEKGKEVYSIAGGSLSKEVSTKELLLRLPGITKNISGQLYLVGGGEVTYRINGRRPRPGELELVTPDRIERISLDRNRSAFSDGKALVDITLKKNLKDYASAYLYHSTALGDWGSFSENPSVTINLQNGKWNGYVGYSYTYDKTSNIPSFKNNTFDYPEGVVTENRSIRESLNRHSHSLNTGIEYKHNPANSFSIQYSLQSLPTVIGSFNDAIRFQEGQNSQWHSEHVMDMGQVSHSVTGRYQYSGKGGTLTVDVGYGYANQDTENNMLDMESGTQGKTFQNITSSHHNVSSSVSYEKSLGASLDFSSEIRYSHGTGNYNYLNQQETDSPILYTTRNKEDVFEADLGLSYSVGKWYINASLGIERFARKAFRNGEAINIEPVTTSVVPYLNASFKPSDAVQMSLGATYSTYVPSLYSMDTTKVYIDKYMYKKNAWLPNPIKRYSINYNVSLRKLGLSFGTSLDIIDKQTQLVYTYDEDDPRVICQTSMAVKATCLGLFMNYSKEFGTLASVDVSVTADHNFKDFVYLGEKLPNKTCYTLDVRNYWQLVKGLVLSGRFRGKTKSIDMPRITRPYYTVSLGISYNTSNWTFQLDGNNLLKKYFSETIQAGHLSVYSQSRSLLNTSAQLTVVYRFNKFRKTIRGNYVNSSAEGRNAPIRY